MSNLALVTDNMLPVANETFIDNLSAGISAGAAIVPINSLAEYADGDSVVLTVDPGTASQATFIGEKQGNTVIDCKWTEGNVGASHSAGATVIDYDSATHYNVVTKLLRMFANENGSLKTTAVQAALNISSAVPADWTPLANVPTVTATNGMREQELTFTGVDYRDRLGIGTKLRVPRTGTTPTQSMRFLIANNQYAEKSGPAGFTFTDDFTMEALIKPDTYTHYTTSNQMGILCRRQGDANGFSLSIDPSGRVEASALNASAFRIWTSYQSVDLTKVTHIAATMDISAGVYQIFIDGQLVPGFLQTTGSMTELVQPALPYRLGAHKSDSIVEIYSGSLAEVRVWSTIRTAQQIRDNMNKQIAAQAGLVAYHKGNGDFNDTSSNANNLTPSGGAIATSVEHLFSPIEYGIITKVDYTDGDTVVRVFTGKVCTFPTDTLSAVSYSTVARPYGFPADKMKWRVSSLYKTNQSGNYISFNNWVDPNARLNVPYGDFNVGVKGDLAVNMTAAGIISAFYTLQNYQPVNAKYSYDCMVRLYNDGSNQNALRTGDVSAPRFSSGLNTPFILWGAADAGSGSVFYNLRGDQGVVEIFAECGYI